MAEKIIEIKELYKSYGDVKAVDGVSFDVEEGSLFAFLGINGAGKSTTINIICSILAKDSGSVKVCGYDLDKESGKIKENIGMVFQGSVLDQALSVKDNLAIRASFYGLCGQAWKERLKELDELLSLGEFISRPYGKLSGGQKRRVDIARGLINRPKVLILDEPTTGLDPQTRKKVWSVIEELRREGGMTVFLTTHYMEEADNADRVVIIDDGKVVANDTPNNLKNIYSGDYVKLYVPRNDDTAAMLEAEGYKYAYESEYYKIKVADSGEAKKFILSHADVMGDFEVVKGDMDDVFINATGKRPEEDSK